MSNFDPAELFGLRRGPRGPRPRVVRERPRMGRGGRIAGIVIAILVAVIVVGLSLMGLRVQYLFLDNLGHSNVFWTPLLAKVITFVIGFVVVGGLVAANIPFWRRAAAHIDERGPAAALLGGGLIAAIAGLGGGAFFGSRWEAILLWLHARDFGTTDPVFNQDIGFFIFRLPAYDAIQGLFWGGLVVSLLVTIAVGAACAGVEYVPEELPVPLRRTPGSSPLDGMRGAALHAGILLSGIFVMAALGAHFGVYHLSTNQHDGFVGLDATERDVVKPVLGLLQWLALALAVASVVIVVRRRRSGALGSAIIFGSLLAGWLLVAGVSQGVPAAIYNGVHVGPNAASVQLPPISDFLATSRQAWALQPSSDVDVRQFGQPPGSPPVSPTVSDLAADPGTLINSRLQDSGQLPEILDNLDKVRRSYQTYPKVSVDRYPTPSGETAVMLGPREIEEANLPSQSFTNQAFVFTHGAGVTAVSVNQLDTEGNPQVLASIQQGSSGPVEKLTTGAPVDLAVRDPRIYCGLQTTLPVVVNTTADAGHPPEFDGAGTDSFNSYGDLPGGLPVPGAFDRLALSLTQFHGLDLLLTSSTQANSRIFLHREVTDRITQLAPWLRLDGDPYVVADSSSGHLVFIVDAYVASSDYPDASRMDDGTSYMRNAVKAVVDARTCDTTLYAVDMNEPMTAAYNDIYPGLLTPLDRMPASLRSHLRYPEDLFNAQAGVYAAVHIDPKNPSALFTKTDLFRVAEDSQAAYVELTLPGETKPQFVLLQTFSPNSSNSGAANNMVEWFAAVSDYTTTAHPRLVAVPLAGGNVLGPIQFDQNVNTNKDISSERTLLGSTGSKVVLGNIVVLPFNGRGFLYVRPLYVQAANGSFPQIREVIVGTRETVAHGPTLADALHNLFGQDVPGLPTGATTPVPTPSPSPGPSPRPGATPSPSPAALSLTAEEVSLLQDLLTNQAAEQSDLAAKNYDAYARDEAAVQRDIDRLRTLLGPGFSAGPSPSPPAVASPTP